MSFIFGCFSRFPCKTPKLKIVSENRKKYETNRPIRLITTMVSVMMCDEYVGFEPTLTFQNVICMGFLDIEKLIVNPPPSYDSTPLN